ncbi:Uncharacterized protein GBIM_10722 [Gryllus bimaculatus]|nr:Uncharacterized protein GBIM_10722 [Gryllus bimaculatus]
MTDALKGKDSLMKKLLSTAPNISVMPPVSASYTPTPSEYSSNVPSPTSDSSEDTSTKLTTFLRQLARQTGRELNVVLMDHAYSKPGNWRSENTYAKPTKSLFVHQVPPLGQDEKDVDVEYVEEVPIPPYDLNSVTISMAECEKYIEAVNPGEKDDDWEEQVDKTNWTMTQQRVFSKVVRALHSDRLARLTCSGNWNEPVQRRVIVDKTARRMRHLLACYSWDQKLTHWLHTTLLDCLSPLYLGIYIDVLQTLRTKCPVMVDRMLSSAPIVNRPGLSGLESLNLIVKQPWDPVASSLNEHKPQKLPGNPVIVMVPCAPMNGNFQSPRLKQWESYFASLGSVVPVIVKTGPDMYKTPLTNCLDQMVCASRVKVAQLRADYPGRHIILVGWNAGSAIAVQVALVEQVSAVVCLGFPVFTVEGRRGEPNDTLLDLRCPAFFVIGQNAASVRQEDMEDIRERMRVETGLVIVGSADDLLRVGHTKKQREGLTQSMVDRCILDEVGDFLGSILMSPRPPPLRTISNQSTNITGLTSTELLNSGVREHKRKNTSESSTQPAKRSRPGTPLHGLSGPPSTPVSSPLSGTSAARQKARGSSQKNAHSTPSTPDAKWSAPTSASNSPQPVSVSDQPISAPSGITVNIGSLGSLTPLGPLRLAQNTSLPTATSLAAASSASEGTVDSITARGRGTSLTIQGNLISSVQQGVSDRTVTQTGRAASLGKGSLQLQGKQLVGRAIGKATETGTLTSLSSLLQGTPGTRIMVSSSSSLLLTPSLTTTTAAAAVADQQIKVLGSDEHAQDSISAPTQTAVTNPRVRTAAGRMLDLSKLTVLTPSTSGGKNVLSASGSGNVVMLTDSSRTTRPVNSGPLLVPVSSVSPSPFTILPLASKTTKASTDRNTVPRSFTVIPKISVPSLKLNQSTGQQAVTVSSATKLAFPSSTLVHDQDQSIEMIPETSDVDKRGEELTPDKILELPIIFAKDGDDTLFTDSKMESDSLNTPTVLPISSCGSVDSSPTVTLGDTISFPLDDSDSEKISEMKPVSAQRAVPNVFIIRSKNANKEKLQPPAGKRILQKTHRFLRTVDKLPTQNQPSQNQGSGIKYTKIILTNRNSSLKVGDIETTGSSCGSMKREQVKTVTSEPVSSETIHGGIILDDEDDEFDIM